MDYVQALLAKRHGGFLRDLARRFRLRVFLTEGLDAVRAIPLTDADGDLLAPERIAEALSTRGQVTALGAALEDLARRHTRLNVSGLLVFSDFVENSGLSAVPAARRLGVPLYTVGVGAVSATDISVDLLAPPVVVKDEEAAVTAVLRQSGLDGASVRVRLTARSLDIVQVGELSSSGDGLVTSELLVDEKEIVLRGDASTAVFSFHPGEVGRTLLVAEADAIGGEAASENNRAEREVHVRDDVLRVLFVEYEPTWEWRFLKEAFHRDPRVGPKGFRTFLRSADPKVRQLNDLFLPALTMGRRDLFSFDVVFLGDLPAAALPTRFCDMLKELVSTFGGGLVVAAGPRFGPGQLAGTPLGDILPVILDPEAKLRGDEEFPFRRTPAAELVDFMRLGSSDAEHEAAWSNLGPLPWYQPAARPHSLATVLAEHPSHTCAGGKTRQPLLALRRYGRGEVLYLAFNETWRLRRSYGERYFRQFWGQVIQRLGMSHAPGAQKRFVVRTDRDRYRVDDEVLVTVEAYDADFKPLAADGLESRKLSGEVRVWSPALGAERVQVLDVPFRREGVFEARVRAFAGGDWSVRVKDPIGGALAAASFEVSQASAERRAAVRNTALQRELASTTGGRACELWDVERVAEELEAPSQPQSTVRVVALWNTWLCFWLVVLLMLAEWFLRKLVNLA
jgi:hypothetical protein